MHLGQRIPVPVVGEADDVPPRKPSHGRVPPRLDLGWPPVRPRRPTHLVRTQPQLEDPERIQLFLAVADAVLVIVQQPPERLLAEPLPAEPIRSEQRLAEGLVELLAEPRRDRDGEAALPRGGAPRRPPFVRGGAPGPPSPPAPP